MIVMIVMIVINWFSGQFAAIAKHRDVGKPCNRLMQPTAMDAVSRAEKWSSRTTGNRTVSAMQAAQCGSVPDDGSVQLQQRG